MGMKELIISRKIGKKDVLLTLLAHKQCSFDRIDVFWPNLGKTKGDFFCFSLLFFGFFSKLWILHYLESHKTQKLPKFLPLCFRKKGFIFLEKMSSSFFYSFHGRKKLHIEIEDLTQISSVLVKFEIKWTTGT